MRTLTLWVSEGGSAMPYFERAYLKEQIPNFFRTGRPWVGGKKIFDPSGWTDRAPPPFRKWKTSYIYIYIWRHSKFVIPPHRSTPKLPEIFDTRDFPKKSVFLKPSPSGDVKIRRNFWKISSLHGRDFFLTKNPWNYNGEMGPNPTKLQWENGSGTLHFPIVISWIFR